jgi:hypothetical protein
VGVARLHVHPNATTEDLLEAALDLLLAKKAKEKGFNLRLTCRFHNQAAARDMFGAEFMDRFTAGAAPPTIR